MTHERSDIVRDGEGFEVPDLHSSTAAYAGRFAGSAGRWFLRVQEEATASLLRVLPSASCVLDAGGGHGQNLELLVRLGMRITVLGSSADSDVLVREPLGRSGGVFKVGHLTRMPLADVSCDAALCYRILPHLHDWQGCIAELCRVSRRLVLLDYPVWRSWNCCSSLLFGAKHSLERTTRPYTIFAEADIVRVFRDHGFRPAGRKPQYFWPMALHRLHGSAGLGRLLEWPPQQLGLTGLFGSPVIGAFVREGL